MQFREQWKQEAVRAIKSHSAISSTFQTECECPCEGCQIHLHRSAFMARHHWSVQLNWTIISNKSRCNLRINKTRISGYKTLVQRPTATGRRLIITRPSYGQVPPNNVFVMSMRVPAAAAWGRDHPVTGTAPLNQLLLHFITTTTLH